jgi:hypothetical protein
MAEKGSAGKAGGSSPTHTSGQDVKMGNITTAASSTMGPRSFVSGYEPNEGELLNKNLGGKRK